MVDQVAGIIEGAVSHALAFRVGVQVGVERECVDGSVAPIYARVLRAGDVHTGDVVGDRQQSVAAVGAGDEVEAGIGIAVATICVSHTAILPEQGACDDSNGKQGMALSSFEHSHGLTSLFLQSWWSGRVRHNSACASSE